MRSALEHDRKEPSYEAGRVRDPSVAARQGATGVRARLMQLLRVAARKREDTSSDAPETMTPGADDSTAASDDADRER
jgi:hypothetical protein